MLNVALIGYGYWGKKLSRNFQNSEFSNIKSICDIKKSNLKQAKNNYPLIEYFSNYKTAIQNKNINLVVVASPTSSHYKIAKFALENYKNVLVEKPLSLSLAEVKKLTYKKLEKKYKKLK